MTAMEDTMTLAVTTQPIRLRPYYCVSCRRFLLNYYLLPGSCIQVSCRSCKTVNTLQVEDE